MIVVAIMRGVLCLDDMVGDSYIAGDRPVVHDMQTDYLIRKLGCKVVLQSEVRHIVTEAWGSLVFKSDGLIVGTIAWCFEGMHACIVVAKLHSRSCCLAVLETK